MSGVFDGYAAYYDLLYRDKDYATEADHVASMLRSILPEARSIIEFGCGSGAHAAHLHARGFRVIGVDQSTGMLAAAEARRDSLGLDETSMRFVRGDVQSVRLGERADAVISLFHVVSYQTSVEALRATIASARAHLDTGGLFFFDAWHGLGVEKDPPTLRVRRLRDSMIEVTRIAEPVVRPQDHVVEVHYQVFVRELATAVVQELREEHHMRYLFVPEMEGLLADGGFRLLRAEEWMTGAPASADAWYVSFLAEAV